MFEFLGPAVKHFLLKLQSWKHADSLIFTGDFPKKDYLE